MWIVSIVVIVGWIASVCLHEFGHAVVAYWGGDKSVKDKGYLTFNPTKYIDPQMSLVLPVIFLLLGGIALPGAAVYINHGALRNRQWRSAVSAAGPIASAIAALILSVPFWLGNPDVISVAEPVATSLIERLWLALALLSFLNIYMVFLNSLPIPPLDGFGVLRPWLPPHWQAKANNISKYGIVILFGLIFFVQPFNQFLTGTSFAIVSRLGIPQSAIIGGYSLFRQGSIPIVIVAIAAAIIYQRFFKPLHQRYTDQGRKLLQSGRYDAALAKFDAAIAHQSDCYQAYYLQGLTLECLRRYDEAIDAYGKAIAINPEPLESYQRQASLLTQHGRHREGWRREIVACYQKVLASNPQSRSDQAAVLFFSEQYEAAIALYNDILATNSEVASFWHNKACCYSHLGNLDQVVSCLERAIALDPQEQEVAQTDPDLAQFRENPRFQSLVRNPHGQT